MGNEIETTKLTIRGNDGRIFATLDETGLVIKDLHGGDIAYLGRDETGDGPVISVSAAGYNLSMDPLNGFRMSVPAEPGEAVSVFAVSPQESGRLLMGMWDGINIGINGKDQSLYIKDGDRLLVTLSRLSLTFFDSAGGILLSIPKSEVEGKGWAVSSDDLSSQGGESGGMSGGKGKH